MRKSLLVPIWLLLFLIMPAPVLAHAQPVQIYPRPGSSHLGTPAEIRLIFDEPVQDGARIQLFGQGTFTEVAGIGAQHDLSKPEQIFAPLPDLPANTYFVQWQVTARDGHSLTGQFSFATGSSIWAVVTWWWVAAAVIILLVIVFITRKILVTTQRDPKGFNIIKSQVPERKTLRV